MIEGLIVTVTGKELVELCLKRAEHHDKRAKVYADQKASMTANEIEGMNYSNGDPKKILQDRIDQHQEDAAELAFIADHLEPSETYRLKREDLQKLGISHSQWR